MNLPLTSIFKALGIKVDPAHIAAIERLIPQIPARANQAIQHVNGAVARADQRANALEARMMLLEEKIEAIYRIVASESMRRSEGRIDAIGRDRIALGDGGSHPASASNGAD